MIFRNDRHRRAVFANMFSSGVSLKPLLVPVTPDTVFLDTTYTGIKVGEAKPDIQVVDDKISVPDWVGAKPQQVVQEEVKPRPELDALAEYAKTLKPVDSSVQVIGDKSDVTKQVDDLLAQYGKSLPEEKKIVGAIRVDDEYAEGPIKLIVRNRVRKDLDSILNVHSRAPDDRIDLKQIDGKLSVTMGGQTKIIDVPIGDDIYLNNLHQKTIGSLKDGYRLNEHDLSYEERRRLKELFKNAVQ